MFPHYLLTLLLLLGSLRGRADSHRVVLESLDGQPTALTLSYTPLSGHPMTASIPTDRLLIHGKGVMATKVLGRRFLQVTYYQPAGTDMAAHETVLLCIDKGRLHQALLTTSYLRSYFTSQDSTRIFSLRLHLTGTDSRTFRLSLSEADHTFDGFPEQPRLRYAYTRSLRFDAATHCFYFSRKAINKTMLVYDAGAGREASQRLGGPYPYVLAGDYQYYLVNGAWYNVAQSPAFPTGVMAFKYPVR